MRLIRIKVNFKRNGVKLKNSLAVIKNICEIYKELIIFIIPLIICKFLTV